jgi:hypothetical protein
MSKMVTIHRTDGTKHRVDLPDEPWFMAVVEGSDTGSLDDLDNVYIREVVVLGAADARAARRAAERTCGRLTAERVESCRKTDRDMAAYYLMHGEVVYA